MKKQKKDLATLFLTFFYVLFFIVDAIYKYSDRILLSDIRLGPIVKGVFILIVVFYSFYRFDKNKLHILLAIFLLLLNYFLGQYFLNLDVHSIENFNVFFKYQFVFFTSILLFDILKQREQVRYVWQTYKVIIFINSLMVYLGMIFNVQFFKTYKGPWRFGYDGLIAAQNEASYFFIFAITILYYRYFYQEDKSWLFWFVFISGLLVGTKAVLLYLLILVVYHIFERITLKKILITIFLAGSISYLFLFRFINSFLINAWQNFEYFYKTKGFLFAITSGRNLFFEQKLIPILSRWNFINWIFGGHDIVKYYTEMGFIDLFLFFGFFGFLLYLYLFFRIFNKVNFSYKFKLFFTLLLMGVVFISGHFFESAIAGINLIMFIVSSNYQSTQNKIYDNQ